VNDSRTAIWGGATIGLFVGLILGFFVGTYWMTVVYAVLIGAATGVVANILSWTGEKMGRRLNPIASPTSAVASRHVLSSSEKHLREHRPADFETTPNVAAECIYLVRRVEDEESWRAGYDSLDSFYAAHEAQHPDIRVYASVSREIVPMGDPSALPDGIGTTIVQRIAAHRAQQR